VFTALAVPPTAWSCQLQVLFFIDLFYFILFLFIYLFITIASRLTTYRCKLTYTVIGQRFIGFRKTIHEPSSLNRSRSLTDTKRDYILGHKNADLVRN